MPALTARQRYRQSAKGRATERRYRLNNKPRERAQAKVRYYKGAKVKQREWYLQTTYGLSTDQWNTLFEAQNRSCAVCGSTDPFDKWGRWHTDHDHVTGAVRGILCAKCNKALGWANDDPGRLRMLLQYLEEGIMAMPALKLEQPSPPVT